MVQFFYALDWNKFPPEIIEISLRAKEPASTRVKKKWGIYEEYEYNLDSISLYIYTSPSLLPNNKGIDVQVPGMHIHYVMEVEPSRDFTCWEVCVQQEQNTDLGQMDKTGQNGKNKEVRVGTRGRHVSMCELNS